MGNRDLSGFGWALLALAACSPGPDKPTPTPNDGLACSDEGVGSIEDACCGLTPTLTITTGDRTYSPMPEGFEATMVHGPQGGWHVAAGATMSHLRSVVDLRVTLTEAASGSVIADTRYYVGVLADDACGGLYPELLAFLDVSALAEGDRDTPPELLSGAAARMDMTAVDSDGHYAQAAVDLVLVPDPIDVSPTPSPSPQRPAR